MNTQLSERLRELAEDAPSVVHAGDLWISGRRLHRRRIATVAAVVGCLVVASAVLGYGDWRSRQPAPASPPPTSTGPMAIPDRFYEPSPWLPSTSAPGRLVAIMNRVEKHHVFGGSTQGVVGVAAGSQRYSFLDLPGHNRAFVSDVALAPDGHHLAYAYDGPVAHSSNQESDAYGVAILDLMTGRVSRRDVPTPYGFNNVAFRWASGSMLMVDVAARYDDPDGHLGSNYRGVALRCAGTQFACVKRSRHLSAQDSDAVTGGSGYAYVSAEHRVVVVDPVTGPAGLRSTSEIRSPMAARSLPVESG